MNKINKQYTRNGLHLLAFLMFAILTVPAQASAQAGYVTGYNTTSYNNNVGSYNNNSSYNPNYNQNPVPSISSIYPNTGALYSGQRTITITGNGFVPGSSAQVDGASRGTTFMDSSRLSFDLYSTDMYGASRRNISVFNPGPGGGNSNTVVFTLSGSAANTTNARTNTVSNTTTQVASSNTNTSTTGSTVLASEAKDLTASAIFGGKGFLPSGLVEWIVVAILILIIVILIRKISGADEKYQAEPLKHA